MADRVRCRCRRCTTRSLMGPAVLITLGVLFLIGRWHGDYEFGRTWPILLLVIGAIKLGEALVASEGHVTQ